MVVSQSGHEVDDILAPCQSGQQLNLRAAVQHVEVGPFPPSHRDSVAEMVHAFRGELPQKRLSTATAVVRVAAGSGWGLVAAWADAL